MLTKTQIILIQKYLNLHPAVDSIDIFSLADAYNELTKIIAILDANENNGE